MPDTVKVYKDKNNEWRWHRVAPNGEIVSESGEGYERKAFCISQAYKYNEGVEHWEVEGSPDPREESDG